MDLNKFTIDLDPDCEPLPAACSTVELFEIERRCGSVSGVACRFMDVNASFTECGHILEILLKAGAPESFPSRAEIDRWMVARGIGEVIALLNPFLTRVMLGETVEDEEQG